MGEFVASHCDSHYVGFFLLGSDVANYATVGELFVLGHLVSVNEETCVFFLNIFDTLEKGSDFIGHGPGTF